MSVHRYLFISVLLHMYMAFLQLLIIFLVCNLLQTVAEVMPFDRDRVASMIVRDVSTTNQAFHSNSVNILEVFVSPSY